MELRLLKHQAAFIKVFLFESLVWALAIVSGFGGGKSYTLASTAVVLLMKYPGMSVGVYSATFDLLKLINITQISAILEMMNLKYTVNKSDMILTVHGYGRVIFRSLDNPHRIIGYEHAFALIDELDTLPQQKAERAWNMVIARNRQKLPDGMRNKVGVFTTPEGYRFVYQRWEKESKKGYKLIRARTTDNIHLPDEYVDNLRDTYSDELIEAYINGEFVNLNGTAVYSSFDRKIHDTKVIPKAGEDLHIGMDFNVEHMAAIVHVIRDNVMYAVKEFVELFDTPDLIQAINSAYTDDSGNRLHRIYVYPDSSGKNRKPSDASVSDISQLKLARFRVRARPANPAIKDRVSAMNYGFKHLQYYVNVDECPEYTEDLEQQVYTTNGLPDKSAGDDHSPDAGGYCRHYLYPVRKRETYLQAVAM